MTLDKFILQIPLFLLCICLLSLLHAQSGIGGISQLLVRRISTGYVRGKIISIKGSENEVMVNAFLYAGIPYAKIPVKKLRFLPSRDPDTWEGTRDATQFGTSCFFNTSFDDMRTPIPMSEDCLHVNVFTSERCLLIGGCPVLHYIYGGQFMFGAARKLDSTTIAENFCSPDRNVVVVTFDYRMNVFGLLNLNYRFHDLNPPNTAIHDIVASLKWTQREIAHFGGDPNRVTVAGQSSGSVAAQILSVCPRANFLFQQVISMSGPGTIEMLPKNRNQRPSRRIALLLGCCSSAEWQSEVFWSYRGNVARVLDCLQTIPPEVINSVLPRMEAERLYFHGLAAEISPNGIITDTFQNLLHQNPPKHPLLTGTVAKEFQDSKMIVNIQTGNVDLLRLWLYCRRLIRQMNYENRERALAECVREYDDVGRAISLFDDLNYFVPHYMFAMLTVQQMVPAFLYQFDYEGIGKAFKQTNSFDSAFFKEGPRHVQDLVYLFGENRGEFTAKDRRIQRLHSQLFVNFIANGTLNGGEIRNARAFRPEQFNYYRIDFVDQQNWAEFAGDIPDQYHKRAVRFWMAQMPKVGGKAHMLSDEALIDDRMISSYLAEDLVKFAELQNGTNKQADDGNCTNGMMEQNNSLWTFVAVQLALLLFAGAAAALTIAAIRRKYARGGSGCAARGGERAGYEQIR